MSEQALKIGSCLSLSGPLASNGKTARLTHQLRQEYLNRRGGLLGRPVRMICYDDATDPKRVAEIYRKLLDEEKVDLVIDGYGDNSVAPAMPLIIERKRYLVALMALAVNATFAYENYFVMIPTGPRPTEALTEGFCSCGKAVAEARNDGHPCCRRALLERSCGRRKGTREPPWIPYPV